MIISIVSVNAFAYTSDYITIDCPKNYDEEDYSDAEGFYVNVYYSEYALDENNEEYYTGNTVDIYAEACWGDTLETYYDEETLEWLVELHEEYGEEIEVVDIPGHGKVRNSFKKYIETITRNENNKIVIF